MNTPVVRLGSVQVRVSAKEPGTAVSLGKCVRSGLMTEGAPERKYLQGARRLAGSRFGVVAQGHAEGHGGEVPASRDVLSTHTVMLRSGQWSPKVPPCSLKVMRFQTAMTVSSGMWKWKSSMLAKERKGLSLRGVRVK